MQTLQTYIKQADPSRTHGEWAALLGTSRSYFCELVNGSKRPGPKLIRAINAMTGGKVPPAVWYLDEGAVGASAQVPSEITSINAADPAPMTGAGQP